MPRLDVRCHEITQFVGPPQNHEGLGIDTSARDEMAPQDQKSKESRALAAGSPRPQNQVSLKTKVSNPSPILQLKPSSPSSFVTNPFASPPQNEEFSAIANSSKYNAILRPQGGQAYVSTNSFVSPQEHESGFVPPHHESGFTILFCRVRAEDLEASSPNPTPADMAHLADPASMEMD